MSKTAREIELEKKLSIAVKALRYYANSNCWDDCFYNGRVLYWNNYDQQWFNCRPVRRDEVAFYEDKKDD